MSSLELIQAGRPIMAPQLGSHAGGGALMGAGCGGGVGHGGAFVREAAGAARGDGVAGDDSGVVDREEGKGNEREEWDDDIIMQLGRMGKQRGEAGRLG